MQQQDTVTSLKAELIRAMDEINALKDGPSSLKEQCGKIEASLHQEPTRPETSCSRGVEKENQVLKEEVNLLKVRQRRLEEELIHKNQLIVSANEDKRAQTNAHIICLALLTIKEQELKKSLTEVGEIKALKDGTSSLKEQVEQLQEKLREKDGLIQKETRKKRQSFKGFADCLFELTECQAKCGRLEASLHQEPYQPETSWSREVEVEKENQVRKEEVNLLKVGQRRLEDELINKNHLIMSANEEKRAQTNHYIICLALLTIKEKELKKSLTECGRLEASLHQEPTQPETSWSRDVEKENLVLKEAVNLLKVGQRRLEEELIHKNQLIVSANEEKRTQTSAYIDCLALLTTKEQELKRSLTEVGEINALKDGTSSLKEQVEQLQEQLREKDCLVKKETRKQRKSFKGFADCLFELTECQAKCERAQIEHRSRGTAPRPAHSLRDTRSELVHVKEPLTDSPAAS
ncbi:unnamed protein product [Pleuronectes platessa]|uniref:Uncharacterized protein n=1 Tax=Pleuronectes platessa TaxID=8262 RepID=A0A9N7YLP6_PLEPL|nr:unnamed protein product [Pleuronectes platessa]